MPSSVPPIFADDRVSYGPSSRTELPGQMSSLGKDRRRTESTLPSTAEGAATPG